MFLLITSQKSETVGPSIWWLTLLRVLAGFGGGQGRWFWRSFSFPRKWRWWRSSWTTAEPIDSFLNKGLKPWLGAAPCRSFRVSQNSEMRRAKGFCQQGKWKEHKRGFAENKGKDTEGPMEQPKKGFDEIAATCFALMIFNEFAGCTGIGIDCRLVDDGR